MSGFTVTLKDLRQARACVDGYNKVVCALSGREFDPESDSYIRFKYDKPIELLDILGSNGFDDALWALRCVDGKDRDIRLFAVWCAEEVRHLMLDERSIKALEVAKEYAYGKVTKEELDAAGAAAWDAAWAAAGAGRRTAARAAAWAAAWDAAWAVGATARAAARDAAGVAAWDAGDTQKKIFIAMCQGNAPWQTEGAEK